ncbi:alkaline phosphatase, tissue-nonspecific isozyme-like isoform X2 [Oratosquilla oratoria]|uniref:alkaline phosphatase, tissue-nonspecific isozyme-like isoform X2 n=1 Tax=Oratosquilla oratoria TaxID=337810 RepID=UPI003F759A7B
MGRYLFIFAFLLICSFIFSHALKKQKSNIANLRSHEDQAFWNELAQEELTSALNRVNKYGVAKNVILFLGDGMSITTLTAARIYKGQLKGQNGEEGRLVWENFPQVGLSKTYTVDRQVPDSASTATAFLTGVKTNFKTTGIDSSGRYDDCSSITSSSKLTTIANWAQEANKRTGFVTTTRVTHASPAPLYAHSANRNWECDANIDDRNAKLCPDFKDIARQLIEDEPGKNLNVIFGGGIQNFDYNATSKPNDPVEVTWGGCLRADGRQLWRDWLEDKANRGHTRAYVNTLSELEQVNTKDTEFILGLFANSHLPYEHIRKQLALDKPSLAQMTRKAIEVLQEGKNGYFLLVEGGHIDRAHHDGLARIALDETVALDEAVQVALEMTQEDETLIVVTADHAHTLSMSGYPERGNDILGPMSYLFHGLHEQNYIAHVMSYASCVGANKRHCEPSAATRHGSAMLMAVLLCLLTMNGMSW